MHNLAPYRGNETILLADDDPDVMSFMTHLLDGLGYNVLAAANGAEAVDLFIQHKEMINAIILDIMMPIKDGIETHKEIKELQPDAKIIFISGFNCHSLEKIANVRCLTKPCQPLTIAKSLRETLDEYSSVPAV